MRRTFKTLSALVVAVASVLFLNRSPVAAEGFELPEKHDYIERLYNPNTGEHLYTPSSFEAATLRNLGWKGEGNAWAIPDMNTLVDGRPNVSRLYNPNTGDHHYTADLNEESYLVSVGWERDFISFPTAGNEGAPVYRLYNPNVKVGSHHYTLDSNERAHLIAVGWKDEGVAFNAYPL
ncbi:hypothetical protein M2139_000222 [Enterococcus sp. PF1-24]|uniref:hypothetical protein n=1 Tax=unclassified Enterococcus TaxID=2608891 RepID=UPI002473B4B0|nr:MULTISPECIES: hypothetical protein [unclassified Enterococcus]MDH6363358.1 hypothetical protein [Enterococcus sp. PFB1-1]MDH6400341.1 hypothetical protein [Enterococcus sp. PF1-24]